MSCSFLHLHQEQVASKSKKIYILQTAFVELFFGYQLQNLTNDARQIESVVRAVRLHHLRPQHPHQFRGHHPRKLHPINHVTCPFIILITFIRITFIPNILVTFIPIILTPSSSSSRHFECFASREIGFVIITSMSCALFLLRSCTTVTNIVFTRAVVNSSRLEVDSNV